MDIALKATFNVRSLRAILENSFWFADYFSHFSFSRVRADFMHVTMGDVPHDGVRI